MKPTKFRSGTKQNDRFKAALQPQYISVEERSIVDLLKYARNYAKNIRFYDLNNDVNGTWSAFLDFSDDELHELAEFAENPDIYQDEPQKLEKYSKPHLTLLLAFFRLLKYPKNQFASLTKKNLEFFYRDVLKLREQDEIPDQVHVIFQLAREVNESLLDQGVQIYAGKDSAGIDLHYKTQEKVVLNKSQVSDIKTIHFSKSTSDLKSFHLQFDRGDEGFERMLCLVLDRKTLPTYRNDYGTEFAIDAVFLRTILYERIAGKERDELYANDAEYIFESLCFPFLKDFWTVLHTFYREMNRGYVGIILPEEIEWEAVYEILENVYKERISRTRRAELKDIHQTQGFDMLMEYVFGDPNPGNLLFAMPNGMTTLKELNASETEAARKYIENHLCMTVDDFRVIMKKKDISLGETTGDEVYILLERAWAKKRNYQYPTIETEFVEGYYADSIYSASKNEAIERFSTFGKSATADSSENIEMGFAVGSPLLLLNEGERKIEAIISAREGTLQIEKISNLLTENPDLFNVYLSTDGGWKQTTETSVDVGKFIINQPINSYNPEHSYLVCDTRRFGILNETSIGWYILFNNGKVYEIEKYDFEKNTICISSVYLNFDTDETKLITSLIPRTFVDPLAGELKLGKYAHEIVHSEETFSHYHQGKYMVDNDGKLFLIKQFISANNVFVRYCGKIRDEQKNDPMIINRIWETIEPEFADFEAYSDISNLTISGMEAADKEFRFDVSDRKLRIEFPVDPMGNPKAKDLMNAWEVWNQSPGNEQGRFEVELEGSGSSGIVSFTKQIELTGETIKRYEALDEKGLRITYRGRPTDKVFLKIEEQSKEVDSCQFLVAGGVLTITPGKGSYTVNQVSADWLLWIQENDPQGFKIESKDTHLWEPVIQSELVLAQEDKQIKYIDLNNSYGSGIRITYIGPESDQPTLLIKENEIDLFDFEIVDEKQLVIKYPIVNLTSGHDLLEEWDNWRSSKLNDPGNFKIKLIGDGSWEVKARKVLDFSGVSSEVVECELEDIGVIAMFRLSDQYQNAFIELEEDTTSTNFSFEFSDVTDSKREIPAKKLVIKYPTFPTVPAVVELDYQKWHSQKMLQSWNRLMEKHDFALVKKKGSGVTPEVFWPTAALTNTDVDFLEDLLFICRVHPDGFTMKYNPPDTYSTYFSQTPKVKLALEENISDDFSFEIFNDYIGNAIFLFIRYPKDKEKRTIEGLKTAWEADPQANFSFEPSGTQKWIISSESEILFSTDIPETMPYTDEARRRFFAFNTFDVDGFAVKYSGPQGIRPKVTIEENTADDAFNVQSLPYFDASYGRSFEYLLIIKYPRRKDKRRLVNLFKAWSEWKRTSSDNLELGFEIVDTTPEVEKRCKSLLLETGNRIREYKVGGTNGMRFTYTGHRKQVDLEVQPIVDFCPKDVGKKILWNNGEVFEVIDNYNDHNIAVQPVGSINYLDNILEYEPEAICLNALKFTTTLNTDFPPIVPDPKNPVSTQPMIQVLFNNKKQFEQKSSESIYYEIFNSIIMERIDLKVDVKNLAQIKARGNVGMINPDNPYQPFGSTPDNTARFYFANREICEKRLDSLNINLKWKESDYMNTQGLPDMEAHYYAYSHCGLDNIPTIKNTDFEVDLEFKDKRSWISISDTPRLLFKHALTYYGIGGQTYQGNLFEEGDELPKDPLDWQRYYKLELCEQGFLAELSAEVTSEIAKASNNLLVAESEYSIIKQEIETRENSIRSARLAEAEARVDPDKEFALPLIPEARALPDLPENDIDLKNLDFNDPYTPLVESISIDYSASSSASFTDDSTADSEKVVPVGFYRYHPFGFSQMGLLANDEDDYLLPHYEKEGYFLIGINDIKPQQTLSLLVQMVSGSGDAHLAIPTVSWSYLAANKWVPFQESHVLRDTTYGLQDTGIVRFSIPEDATMDNTVMPANRCWIRAEASENITAVPDIIDIRTQAMLAQYVNKNNDPNRLGSPLVADTITELVDRDSNIKKVSQPYSSFRGKKREESSEYYARVSERLKHKHRALTLKDYENLILSKFSEIYKVKCLPQGELRLLTNDSEGEVVIVVILKNKNATPFYPLKPKTPANILRDIEKYVTPYMPPLVTVRVVNPRFEEIQYRLAVKFSENHDFGFYINQLNNDIKQFLSPWAYSKDADINFGSSVFSSSIINHIENTDYVDYVANFTLLRQIITHEHYTESIPLFLTEDNAASTKYPDSILVSAEDHLIDVIHTDFYDASAFQGIGYMKIGTDFWINRPGPVFSVGIGEMEVESWPVSRYAFHTIAVNVDIIGSVDGKQYEKEFNITFSQNDSQILWDQLLNSGYIDAKGNVLPKTEAFDPTFHFEFDVMGEKKTFTEYLESHLSKFDFGLKLLPSDFEEGALDDADFNWVYKTLHGGNIIESDVITILKTVIGFTGISQYPFIIH